MSSCYSDNFPRRSWKISKIFLINVKKFISSTVESNMFLNLFHYDTFREKKSQQISRYWSNKRVCKFNLVIENFPQLWLLTTRKKKLTNKRKELKFIKLITSCSFCRQNNFIIFIFIDFIFAPLWALHKVCCASCWSQPLLSSASEQANEIIS